MSSLSDFPLKKKVFTDQKKVVASFLAPEFQQLNSWDKKDRVNRSLVQLIEKELDPCFLLSHVLDYIVQIDQKKIIPGYCFADFELWLNQYSQLSFHKNCYIRGKIVGKWIPREEYQDFFPIGMNKIYFGSHFVTAHKSPDLDSTIASFWGWMEAFACRVGSAQHYWNVPGGPPVSQMETDLIFSDILGEGIFTHLLQKKLTLSLSSQDLMTQEGLIKKHTYEMTSTVDHERHQKAVVIVDDQGYYLGDWRSFDVEGVRQIIMLLNNCMRWFQNQLQLQLITLFAKKDLIFDDMTSFLSHIFHLLLKECEPAKEYSTKEYNHLDRFLKEVLQIELGLEATFEEVGQKLVDLSLVDFSAENKMIASLKQAHLFDELGNILEDRPQIFSYLKEIITSLNNTFTAIQIYMERMDVALSIKTHVFQYLPHFASSNADLEELMDIIGPHRYLTIVDTDEKQKIPVGIVQAKDLQRSPLGTVSLRDFSNRDEMNIPSYLDVISIMDHHKSTLDTKTPLVANVSDVQSTNSIAAQKALSINDKYCLGTMKKEQVLQQLEEEKDPDLLQRLIYKRHLLEQPCSYFIHPQRVFVEYLHYFFGILDDTDLLMKVTQKDVMAMASILNRMKSLQMQKEMKIISFADLEYDASFPKKAAQRILQNQDTYSLYRRVYEYKEKQIEKNIALCAEKKPSTFFLDNKIQNGCSRISQTKMFLHNVSLFQQHQKVLRQRWIEWAMNLYQESNEIDLHMHMISTIQSAEDVFKGIEQKYKHKDQLWIWIPMTEGGIKHLTSFLLQFQKIPHLLEKELEMEFLGDAGYYEKIFQESFPQVPFKRTKESFSMVILYYKAGSINSRKAFISPYLPQIY